jgi:hypothetical protein
MEKRKEEFYDECFDKGRDMARLLCERIMFREQLIALAHEFKSIANPEAFANGFGSYLDEFKKK